MADRTPGEENVQRQGPQVTAGESRRMAEPGDPARGQGGPQMLDRDVPLDRAHEPGRDAGGPGRGASGGAGNARADEPAVPGVRNYEHSEAALGGADTVQKTTWGVGHGTEADGRQEYAPVNLRKGEGSVVARVGPGGGVNPIAWIVGILAALALVAYVVGLFGS